MKAISDRFPFIQEVAIQTEANRIVQRCRQITKGFMPKDVAEKAYALFLVTFCIHTIHFCAGG